MNTETGSADPTHGDTILTVTDLHVSYGQVKALQGVDVAVGDGEIVSVIGPNGAGKTTLADTIGGFLPYRGTAVYQGRPITGRSHADLVHDGLIYCTESRDLFDFMSVEDNLRLGSFRHPEGVEDRLEYVLDLFPVLDDRIDQSARTMSGGEQQMLAIGRALMGEPDLLLLDEPTLGLAPVILEDISDAIDRIRDSGVAILLCEQNATFAMDHADRIYLLENGAVEREGTPAEIESDEYIRDAYLGQ